MVREAGMEKRVFSLASTEEKRLSIGLAVACGLMSMSVAFERHEFYLWTFPLVSALWAIRYMSNRVRKLELSDQGLMMKRFLLKPVSIDWNMVSSVKRGYEVLSFSGGKRFDSAVVRAVGGQSIAVPGTSPNASEILDILKQRLPESVFVAR
jgi:hypothetical protein